MKLEQTLTCLVVSLETNHGQERNHRMFVRREGICCENRLNLVTVPLQGVDNQMTSAPNRATERGV